jgi:phage-related protein
MMVYVILLMNCKWPANFQLLPILYVRIHYSSNQFRIFYFFQILDQIVLVYALSKKTPQVKKQDIELAEKRMEDWMRRFPTGGEI